MRHMMVLEESAVVVPHLLLCWVNSATIDDPSD